jgi:hypothetical protein
MQKRNSYCTCETTSFLFYLCIIMKRIHYVILAIVITLSGCTKAEKTPTSGTDTIDNTIHFSTTYFAYGFSFSGAKLVATTTTPKPDIVLYVNSDNPPNKLTLQANNLNPSFYKLGEYNDEEAAKAAFNDLKTVSVSQWTEMADPVNVNQVWVYRSGSDTYAKIRIISVKNEITQAVPYGECTFQWVYQPDGSTTFPGK